MSVVRITFFPATLPSATALVMDSASDAVVKLLQLFGIGPLDTKGITSKGPGQVGESALDVIVPPRSINAHAMVQTLEWADFWDAERAISRAMVSIPVRYGESLDLGRLLFERDGESDLEIYAMPRSAALEVVKGSKRGILDAEWECPYPYFQETADTDSAEIDVDDSLTVANPGDVDAPYLARIYGPATEVTLTNLTTGQVFTVTVALADDTEWLEVNTTPGDKYIRKHTSPTAWDNAIAGLSTTDFQLWQLRPGNNSVKLEAVGDTADTHAVVSYRPRYAAL